MLERLMNWFSDLGQAIRGLAGAVAHARQHPSEPPDLEEPWFYDDPHLSSRNKESKDEA